jgi:3-dehydroquinate synthetase
MLHDKKAEGGQIKYVVLDELGHASTQAVDDLIISNVLSIVGAV